MAAIDAAHTADSMSADAANSRRMTIGADVQGTCRTVHEPAFRSLGTTAAAGPDGARTAPAERPAVRNNELGGDRDGTGSGGAPAASAVSRRRSPRRCGGWVRSERGRSVDLSQKELV